jgi:hypothetical protein
MVKVYAPDIAVPEMAIAFADPSGNAVVVSAANPLPVTGGSGGGGSSLADQSVVDAVGVYWLVRDNGTTLTYLNWATGATGTPTSPVAPAGKLTGEQVRGTQYNVVTAVTGGAVGDVLEHLVILNIATTPAAVITSAWINITQATVLSSAPTIANLAEIGALVTVTATAANPVYEADAYTAPAAVTWSSATAAGTANTVGTNGFDGVLISLVCAAGITGGVITFEAYDGAAWIPVQAGKMNAYGGATSVALSGGLVVGYQINIAGASQFRARLSTAITGTGNVVLTHLVSSAPMPDPVTVGLDPAQPLPASANTMGTVLGPLPAAPIAGQQTLTASAAALPANALQNGVVVKALPANTGTVYVGPAGVTAANGYPLAASEAISFAIANTGGIYIIGTNTTDKVAYTGN